MKTPAETFCLSGLTSAETAGLLHLLEIRFEKAAVIDALAAHPGTVFLLQEKDADDELCRRDRAGRR